MLLQVPHDPVKKTFSTDGLSWLAMLRLENQYPAPPWKAPKLVIAHTNNRELRLTTMTSIIKLAIIVAMPRLDLRLFSIRFFAHFARFILSPSLQCIRSLGARLRLGSSSQGSQRILTIKPRCFPRLISTVLSTEIRHVQPRRVSRACRVCCASPNSDEGYCLADNLPIDLVEEAHEDQIWCCKVNVLVGLWTPGNAISIIIKGCYARTK